jgi:hypothetical protein
LETKGSEVIKDDFKVEFEPTKGYQNIVAGQRGEIEAITNRASISGNTLHITRDWSIRSLRALYDVS